MPDAAIKTEGDDKGAADAQHASAPTGYKPPPRAVMWHRRYRPQWAERGTVSVPLSCGHEWMFKDDAPVAEIDCEYCAKKCPVPAGMGMHVPPVDTKEHERNG